MVVDFSRFLWKPLTSDPKDSSLVREAAGGELMEYMWRGLGLGDYVVIFMAELNFFEDLRQEVLVRCMQNAWAEVRYEIPTIAAHTIYDEENRTRIIYKPACSIEEAKAWASRTVRLVNGFDNIEQFRHAISLKPIRDENGDQTFLYVLPHGPSGLPSTCSVLVHTSHITFDAKGLHALFTAFMKKLAIAISVYPSAPYERLRWGTEGKNILPAPYEILGEAEIRDGIEYDETLNSVMNDIITSSKHEHGLKPCVSGNYPLETKRATFTFPAQDSLRFFAKVKSLGFTVNQVCNAALTLAAADYNPVPEEKLDSALFSYSQMVDGRPRLRPPFCDRGGYPGFCLGVSPIMIPAKALGDPGLKTDTDRLIHVSSLMKKAYAEQKAYPSLVAIGAEQVEMIMSPFKNKNKNETLPLPSSTTAWYSGDGRGETYLDPIYLDANGKPISEIRSFVTTVSKLDPAPFFRIWSWRDCLTVSVDYNPRAIPQDTIEEVLNRWKQLVALLMQ